MATNITKPVWGTAPDYDDPVPVTNDLLNQGVDYADQEAAPAKLWRIQTIAGLIVTIGEGVLSDGTVVAAQDVTLTANADNYVQKDASTGIASLGTGSFDAGDPLYFFQTDGASVTNLDQTSGANRYDRRSLGGGSGSGGGETTVVTQTAHGLSLGNWVEPNGSGGYAKAKADAIATTNVVGVVAAVGDVDTFTLQMGGYSAIFSGMTPGSAQFLSAATAGAQTETAPATVGNVRKFLGMAISATAMIIEVDAGVEIEANPYNVTNTAHTSTANNLAKFNDTGGQAIRDAGVATSTDGTMAANSAAKLPVESAIVTYVSARITALINGAPGILDTLEEIADALGDDANFAATMTTALAGKQPLDAELTAWAALVSAADKLGYFTGSGAAALTDLTSVARTLIAQTTQALMRTTGLGMSSNGSSLVAASDYAAMKVLLALTIGTDVQAWDADLDAIAGLTSAANKGIYFTGSHAAATFDLTAAGLALLDDAAASNQRTTLGLDGYDVAAFCQGKPLSSAVILRFTATRAFSLPASLTNTQASAGTAATAQTDFDVQKNGSSIGTIRFAASGTVATIPSAAGGSFAAADVLRIIAPATPDATLANIGFTLAGVI